MPTPGDYLVSGAAAAIITFAVTPIAIAMARRLGWVYEPNERTVHTRPIPDVGGVAMFAGFVIALAASRLWDDFDQLFARNDEPRGVLIAAVIMFAVGLLD
ncbi:MAG: undecaprenyl/decaprenyl-phosphate alpha-N-acetylglucosaminyl 1-phosphate transferase, partial [Ilumatobacteraceae bacterium]